MKRFVAVICLLLSACQAAPESPKELTVYSGRKEELVGPLFERFEKETGIKLKVRYGDTAEMAAQILEEGDNSPADVFFSQDAGALGAIESKGRFATLPASIRSKIPTQFRSGRWIGVSGRARVAVFNPERVKAVEMPSSIEQFVDAKWRGRIGWAPTNGSFQSFVTAFRKTRGQDAAKQWLEQMKANNTKAYPKNDAIVQAVSTGEIDVGLVNHYYVFEIKRQDPNLKAENHWFSKPDDVGSLVNVSGVGILDTSKNSKTAQRLVKFLLNAKSQRYFAEETFEYPLVTGVTGPNGLPPLEDISSLDINLGDLSDLEGTLDLLAEVGLL
ncbi:MAG: iron ABC transporter substrate-binding protein [Actinomycetota bacterium]